MYNTLEKRELWKAYIAPQNIADQIIEVLTVVMNNNISSLEHIKNTLALQENLLWLPIDKQVTWYIDNGLQHTKNKYTSLCIDIKKLFHDLSHIKYKTPILLDSKQSILRNIIRQSPKLNIIIENELAQPYNQDTSLSEFFKYIKTTKYSKISDFNERGYRIANNNILINPQWKEVLNVIWSLEQDKYILQRLTGYLGWHKYDIYTHDWKIIINKIESIKKVSDVEYYIWTGPWDRNNATPNNVPCTLRAQWLDWTDIVFHVGINDQHSSIDWTFIGDTTEEKK